MAGLSKLRAVNIALENIGESPVSTLTGSGDAFVVTATSILEETVRDICEELWNFNRDDKYALTPDGSGNITIASNMISVDAHYTYLDYSVRQGKLYDVYNQTFVFDDTVYADVIWEFDYDDLPYHVRKYVAIRAARVFARRILGDAGGDRLTEKDEVRALANAKRNDTRAQDATIHNEYTSRLYSLKTRSPR
jgi:hypothetical protein